jgi:hypothetical protein
MPDRPTLNAARRQVEKAMRLIVSRDGSPYRAGRRVWATAMGHATQSEEVMWPLWLLWGALTDWVEVKPAETREAESAMRRAAREWLALPDDVDAQRAYFDRWLYEEVGYERPAKPSAAG